MSGWSIRSYLPTLIRAVGLHCWLFVINSQTIAQSQSMAQKVDHFIQLKLVKSSVPGLAIAIVHKDSLLFAKGYGKTGTNTSITTNTPFAIASLSKAFTAMAIMQLVDSGQIDLDSPVERYIPSFVTADSHGQAITIRQLLNQTSGLADTGFPELAFSQQPITANEALHQLNMAHLVTRPGEQFHYHNPNYRILANVVEAVSHEPFAHYLEKHIFEPLHMVHTSDVATTQEFFDGAHPLDKGHIFVMGKPVAIQEPDWFIDGAAGIRSSVNDLAYWLIVQLQHGQFENRQLVSPQSMRIMQSVPAKPASRYGMGWFLTEDANLYHSGILWTYSAEQLILTKEEYGIVLLFNGGLNPFVDYYSFIQGVADILENQEPSLPVLPDWFYSVCVNVVLLLLIGLTIRRLFRSKPSSVANQQLSIWRFGFYLFLRLLPIILFILIPSLITAISGRVLNWERIFLMLPDIILELGCVALLNMAVAITQAVRFWRKSVPA